MGGNGWSLAGYLRSISGLVWAFVFCLLPAQSFVSPLSFRRLPLSQGKLESWVRAKPSTTALHGIPKLFRWLVDLYPSVVESVGSNMGQKDLLVDYFYLDMNGIIHTCTHNNAGHLVQYSESEMFSRICSYVDRLYKLVSPRRVMLLAIDGVAPRAKMNQQRARRFRAAKDLASLIESSSRDASRAGSFDSNAITPGTEFMQRLLEALKGWIQSKMRSDPFWKKGAKVVLSGPDVIGEGEHKIMDFVRSLKQHDSAFVPGKNRHCIYGLDADLIMLSLVTHEPNFFLLREKGTRRGKDALSNSPMDFEVLEISVLREMLSQYFGAASQTGGKHGRRLDLERVVDDFVFMCFLVGNDFLPCLPHLDIGDGSLNMMMEIYRSMLPEMGGYLTNKASLHLPRLELFLQEVSRREPLYFEQRSSNEGLEFCRESYASQYYEAKMGLSAKDTASRRNVVLKYLEGLLWVLHYYHHGCPSWSWYYPYLYGPLASDFHDLPTLRPQFRSGKPFSPLLQLLSVLPPQSGNLLPPDFKRIMVDPNSPLFPYYPTQFKEDPNGKGNNWESIVLIPFLPLQPLLATVSSINHIESLSRHERVRNLPGRLLQFEPH